MSFGKNEKVYDEMIRSQENQELESLCDFFIDADKWTGLGSINILCKEEE